MIGDINLLLTRVASEGTRGHATVAAAVVPVWSRTLSELRAPFEAGAGSVAGLKLESAELFHLDNPYRNNDSAVFARDYVQSVTAWGGPLLLRAFACEDEARATSLLADFLGELAGTRGGRPRPLSLEDCAGSPRHLSEGRLDVARPRPHVLTPRSW